MKSILPAVPALAVLIFASCTEGSQVASVKKRMVSPPLASLDPAFQKVEIDAGKDTSMVIPNTLGTVVTYKANSLVDSANHPVKGKVELRYREFHDAYTTVLAGIPMSYELNGKKKNFETAGMFELRASQGNEPLFVRKGSSLGVKFGGKTPGNDFPFYYLDEEKGWNRLGLDSARANTQKLEARRKIEKKKKELSPIPFGSDHFVFNYQAALDVYLKDNRSLIRKSYDDPGIKRKIKRYGLKWIPAYTWEAIRFKGAQYPAMMMVWKNLSGKSIPSWADYPEVKLVPLGNGVFQLTLEDTQKGKRTVMKIEPVMPIKSLFAFTVDQWKTKYDDNMKLVREEEQRMEKMAEVYRFYEVNNFGIYNYDKFIKTNDYVTLNADFRFDAAAPMLADLDIFCVMSEGRGVMRTHYSDWAQFRFFNRSDMKMFTLLPPNRLVVFPAEKIDSVFAAIKSKGLVQYQFGMTTKAYLKTPADLELVLAPKGTN